MKDLEILTPHSAARIARGVGHTGGARTHAVRETLSGDADEHAANLSAWQQLYDQLVPGPFTGRLTELWLDHMQVFSESTSHAVRQSCRVWANAAWFGIPVSRTGAGRICGQSIEPHTIAARPGGEEFELVTPDRYEILGVVVDTATLERHAIEVEHMDPMLLKSACRLSVDPAARTAGASGLQRMLRLAREQAPLTEPALRSWLHDNVLTALFELLRSARHDTARIQTAARAARLAAAAREYAMAQRQPLSVAQLCRYLGVSRVVLQQCLQEILGVSPAAYLRAVRLNAVRRELRNPASEFHAVQDAAYAWGFWHLSQFASDYQRMFGELPSQALRARRGNQTLLTSPATRQ